MMHDAPSIQARAAPISSCVQVTFVLDLDRTACLHCLRAVRRDIYAWPSWPPSCVRESGPARNVPGPSTDSVLGLKLTMTVGSLQRFSTWPRDNLRNKLPGVSYLHLKGATVDVLVLHSLIMHNSRIASTLGGDQLRPSQKPLHIAYCIMHSIREVIMHYEHMSY
jgi:hypothetical protein